MQKKDNFIENETNERIINYKNRLDSINQSLDWKETKCGLWKSKDGDLAIKTIEGFESSIINKYITHLTDGRPFSQVIDTLTFNYLGSSFYKDKNHIYTHYSMLDGGNFWIVEDTDVKTFRVIENSCYTKDKNYIFGERKMKMDRVDYESFRTCDQCNCFAKDKYGYYGWGEKIALNDIEDKEIRQQLRKL